MKLKKPFFTVQRSGSYTKTLEVIKYIGLNTLQTGLGLSLIHILSGGFRTLTGSFATLGAVWLPD